MIWYLKNEAGKNECPPVCEKWGFYWSKLERRRVCSSALVTQCLHRKKYNNGQVTGEEGGRITLGADENRSQEYSLDPELNNLLVPIYT